MRAQHARFIAAFHPGQEGRLPDYSPAGVGAVVLFLPLCVLTQVASAIGG